MPDATLVIGSGAAGLCCAAAVAIWTGNELGLREARFWSTARAAIEWSARVTRIVSLRGLVAEQIERAAWNESPERVAVLAIGLSAGTAVGGARTRPFVEPRSGPPPAHARAASRLGPSLR